MEQRFDSIPLSDTYFKPVILTHEAGLVDVENVQQEHIGTILSEGMQDGDNVRAQIVIHDAESLDYGLRELSLGYTQTPDETPGVWNGQPYDAIQRNIQINHLALVEKARAGEQARLNIDGEEQGGNQMSKARKDGLTPEEIARLVEEYKQRQAQRMQNSNPTADEGTNPDEQTTDEGETDPVQEVKDRRDRRDASGDCETMDEASGVIAQQDEDIQKLLDFIAQLQAKIDFDEASAEEEAKADSEGETAEANADEEEHQENPLNMDSIDAYVNQKIELIRLGDKLNLDGIETMKPMDAKKAIITKVHPNIRLDGKDTAYINAMFDIAKESVGKRKGVDYQRQQMFRGDSAHNKPVDGQNEARRRMIEKMDGGNK